MEPRFKNTYCSQCGQEFGPGDSGYSSCANHPGASHGIARSIVQAVKDLPGIESGIESITIDFGKVEVFMTPESFDREFNGLESQTEPFTSNYHLIWLDFDGVKFQSIVAVSEDGR